MLYRHPPVLAHRHTGRQPRVNLNSEMCFAGPKGGGEQPPVPCSVASHLPDEKCCLPLCSEYVWNTCSVLGKYMKAKIILNIIFVSVFEDGHSECLGAHTAVIHICTCMPQHGTYLHLLRDPDIQLVQPYALHLPCCSQCIVPECPSGWPSVPSSVAGRGPAEWFGLKEAAHTGPVHPSG